MFDYLLEGEHGLYFSNRMIYDVPNVFVILVILNLLLVILNPRFAWLWILLSKNIRCFLDRLVPRGVGHGAGVGPILVHRLNYCFSLIFHYIERSLAISDLQHGELYFREECLQINLQLIFWSSYLNLKMGTNVLKIILISSGDIMTWVLFCFISDIFFYLILLMLYITNISKK